MTECDLARTYAAENRDIVVNRPSAEYAIYKAYLQGWHDASNKDGWHFRNDELPKNNCCVLVYSDWQGLEIKQYDTLRKRFGELYIDDVIAWQPLPSLPNCQNQTAIDNLSAKDCQCSDKGDSK